MAERSAISIIKFDDERACVISSIDDENRDWGNSEATEHVDRVAVDPGGCSMLGVYNMFVDFIEVESKSLATSGAVISLKYRCSV